MTTDAQTAAPTLTIRRTFKAPRERVFAAWTDPQQIVAWWGPGDNTVYDAAFDARVGGAYHIAMKTADGDDFVARGTVTECRPPERLAYTFKWDEDDPKDEVQTLVSIDFLDRNGETEMVFTHANFATAESRDRHVEGWTIVLEQFAAALETGRVTLRGIDLSGYMCKDAKRAIAFYRDVFGLEPETVYPDDRGAEYALPDGSTFGLWGGGGKVMPFQPGNGIMFAVDDLAAAVRTLEARGIPITYRTETPFCYIAMIDDSEGNTVTVHQRKAG